MKAISNRALFKTQHYQLVLNAKPCSPTPAKGALRVKTCSLGRTLEGQHMKGLQTNLYLIIADFSYPSGFSCEADTSTTVMSRQLTIPSKAHEGFADSVRISSHEPHTSPGGARTPNGAAGALCSPPEGPPRLGALLGAAWLRCEAGRALPFPSRGHSRAGCPRGRPYYRRPPRAVAICPPHPSHHTKSLLLSS